MLYPWGFSLLKLNSSFNDIGGLVMIRGMRRLLFDAECSISVWSKITSPVWPVISWNSAQFFTIEA